MRTIGLDTNSILAYRLERQAGFNQVKQLFEQCMSGKVNLFVPLPVLLETEWVLRTSYALPKTAIVTFFEDLLLLNNLIVDQKSQIVSALHLYKVNSKVSFTDCIIMRQIQDEGYELLTFGKDLERLFNII